MKKWFKQILIVLLVAIMAFNPVTTVLASDTTGSEILGISSNEALGVSKNEFPNSVEAFSDTWDYEVAFNPWNTSNWRKVVNAAYAEDVLIQKNGYTSLVKDEISNSGKYFWLASPSDYTIPSGEFTMEVRAKSSGIQDTQGNKIGIRVNASKAIEVYLGHGELDGYVSTSPTGATNSYMLDTTIWHDYRFVVNTDRSYSLYVDGMLALDNISATTAFTSGADLIKFGAESHHRCNMDIMSIKIANNKLTPPPQEGIRSITLSDEGHFEGENAAVTAIINTDLIIDGTTVSFSLVDATMQNVSAVATVSASILNDVSTGVLNIPDTITEGIYYIKAEVLAYEKYSSAYVIKESLGERPTMPDFTSIGYTLELEDYTYNPTKEFNFPSIIDTNEFPLVGGATPLGRYYLFYAPHDAPAGLCLMTADSLDGPWTEHGSNPIISKQWPKEGGGNHYSVSHVSSPHVIWNSVYNKFFMYFHGENPTTRYAMSDDMVTWEYGGVVVTANQFSPTGTGHSEASYARVYEHSIPGLGNKYIMTLMINNSANMRKIFWAHSVDGKVWTPVTTALLSPDTPSEYNYKGNLSGAYFFSQDNRYYVVAHASSGNMYLFEVGKYLQEEKHWGMFYDSADDYPDYARSGAPCFMKDDDEVWHMFYEGGRRLHANIVHAKVMTDEEKQQIRNVDLSFPKTTISVDESINPTITAYDFLNTDISSSGVSYIFHVDPPTAGTFTAENFTSLAPGECTVWVEAIYNDISVTSEKISVTTREAANVPIIETGVPVLDRSMVSGATKANLELPNIIKVGSKYHMYFGYADTGGSNGIALATADNLAGPWTPHNNGAPIISSGSGASVVYNSASSEYFMYYNTSSSSLHRAVSIDGINFTPMGEALNAGNFGAATVNNAYQVSVYPIGGGKYVMFLTLNPGNKKAIGIAFSDDGIAWQAKTTNVLLATTEDGSNIASPRMFEYKGKNYLTFHNSSGNLEFAELDSNYSVVTRNGILYDSVSGEPDINRAADGFFFKDIDSSLHLFYTARSNKGSGSNGSLIAYSGASVNEDVLFFDDFEDGASELWQVLSGNWSVTDKNGNNVYKQGNASGGANNYVGDTQWQNYSFEAIVTPLNANSVITLSGRAQDNNNRYSIGFNKGKLAIAKKIVGNDTSLASKNYTVLADTSYNIKIEFENNDIRLYINGVLELQSTDSSLKKGNVGIATYNSTALFDNVTVKSLDKQVVPTTIKVNEPENYQVIQRSLDSAGKALPSLTGKVTLTGSYGDNVEKVQVKVLSFTDGTEIIGWTDVDTMLSGNFSTELLLPQGGWYRLEAKALDDADNVLEFIIGVNKWGIGINILCVGQSNMQGQGNPPYTIANDLVANYTLSGSWAHLKDPYGGAKASLVPSLGNELTAKLGIPVGFIPAADSGSGLHAPNIGHALGRYWLNRNSLNPSDSNTIYGKSIIRTQQAGGAELIIWNQGETDGRLAIEKEVYMADMHTLLNNFRTDLGLAKIPIFIAQIGNHAENLGDTSTDLAYTGIRTAQRDLDDGENFFLAATEMEFDRVDTAHYNTAALNEIGKRYANAILYHHGLSSYYRGPEIIGAQFADNTKKIIHVSINHRGGTDIIPDSNISSFYIYDDSVSIEIPVAGSSAKRLDSNTIEITLTNAISGEGTLRYLFGFNPPRDNVVKDNTALGLPLEATGDAIEIIAYAAPPIVDKSQLQALYDSYSAITNTDKKYTEKSWALFTSELEKALSVLADNSATSSDVTLTFNNLKNAFNALQLRATQSEISQLEAYVNNYQSMFDKNKYTANSWDNLVDTVDSVKPVLQGKENATSAIILQAITKIEVAISSLVEIQPEPVIKDTMKSAIQKGISILESSSIYTSETVDKLKSAIALAEDVLADINATQAIVDTAIVNINTAIAELVLKPTTPKPFVPNFHSSTSSSSGKNTPDQSSYSVSKSNNSTENYTVIKGENIATVKFVNAGMLTKSALDSITKSIKATNVSIISDQVNSTGRRVDTRLVINSSKITEDVNLGASINSTLVNKVTALFSKWFKNKVLVVHLSQEKFNANVEVAIKSNFDVTDVKNLNFYSYDSAKNTYTALPVNTVWQDSNGYLHFNTAQGGIIIIMSGTPKS